MLKKWVAKIYLIGSLKEVKNFIRYLMSTYCGIRISNIGDQQFKDTQIQIARQPPGGTFDDRYKKRTGFCDLVIGNFLTLKCRSSESEH